MKTHIWITFTEVYRCRTSR